MSFLPVLSLGSIYLSSPPQRKQRKQTVVHMACPGEDDLSGVALDPPNVLENVDAAMGLTGTGAVLAI